MYEIAPESATAVLLRVGVSRLSYGAHGLHQLSCPLIQTSRICPGSCHSSGMWPLQIASRSPVSVYHCDLMEAYWLQSARRTHCAEDVKL